MDLSPFSYVEEYRRRAASADLSSLSGREAEQTELIINSILEMVRPRRGVLVDVGCGDGSLIAKALAKAPELRCIGISATHEETTRLQSVCGAAVELHAADVHELPLPGGCADYVICNSVLHIAPPLDGALRELSRIAKTGAIVFVGEMPCALLKWAPQRSWTRVLSSNLKHHGLAAALGVAAYLVSAATSGQWIKRTAKSNFFIEPAEFIRSAAAAGLDVTEQRPHVWPNRMDYLLVRRQF
jgi:ubiquinone/menaquinone biosynthesis C-methylase UbiE